jgi:hypothetical protein
MLNLDDEHSRAWTRTSVGRFSAGWRAWLGAPMTDVGVRSLAVLRAWRGEAQR